MRTAARIATALGSIGLALYIAAILIRPPVLNPHLALFWPFDWLGWVVIPTVGLYITSWTLSYIVDRKAGRGRVGS